MTCRVLAGNCCFSVLIFAKNTIKQYYSKFGGGSKERLNMGT